MRFMSWDGYHHHLGINLLEGHGAAPVDAAVRGLQSFEVRRIDATRTDPNGDRCHAVWVLTFPASCWHHAYRARHRGGVSRAILRWSFSPVHHRETRWAIALRAPPLSGGLVDVGADVGAVHDLSQPVEARGPGGRI